MLAWGALIPILLRWIRVPSARRMYVEAIGMWLTASAIAFSWPLLHPSTVTALASLGGLLTLSMLGAIPFALSVLVLRQLGLLSGLGALIVFALSMEWILQIGPLAFPWTFYGHTQAATAPFNQLAALGGVGLLSAWVLVLNAAFFLILSSRFRTLGTIVALTVLLAGVGYGNHRLQSPLEPVRTTSALLVQPGLSASTWAEVHNPERVEHLQRLTESALTNRPTPDEPPLVIWPETALPPTWTPPGDAAENLQQWANEHSIQLLTGAIRTAESPSIYYNSAVLFRPQVPAQMYDKNKLVPFAERVPFVNAVPALQSFAVPAGGVAGYARGTETPVLKSDTFNAGALICFESTFGALARSYVRRAEPADFLVTLAQDGWWGQSLGYHQHFAFTRLRAIETGRAMAMVTVTGITGLIDPHGEARSTTEWIQQTAQWVDIPHYRLDPPAIYWGSWFYHSALAFCALFTLLTALSYYRTNNFR